MARFSTRLTRSRAFKAIALCGATTLLSGVMVLSPIDSGLAAAATTLINDTFANSTSSSNVAVASNGATGDEGQSFPCLTAATISQSSPTSNTTTVDSSSTFTDQIVTVGNSGPVTFTTTTSSSDVVVSSSGAVTTTGSLSVGTYPVSGTDSDGTNTGVWSYTLHVTASPSSIQNCNAATPDADGSGSLMLTDGGFGEASNVIYGGSFPTVDGLDITFDTHMYGGSPLGATY